MLSVVDCKPKKGWFYRPRHHGCRRIILLLSLSAVKRAWVRGRDNTGVGNCSARICFISVCILSFIRWFFRIVLKISYLNESYEFLLHVIILHIFKNNEQRFQLHIVGLFLRLFSINWTLSKAYLLTLYCSTLNPSSESGPFTLFLESLRS